MIALRSVGSTNPGRTFYRFFSIASAPSNTRLRNSTEGWNVVKRDGPQREC